MKVRVSAQEAACDLVQAGRTDYLKRVHVSPHTHLCVAGVANPPEFVYCVVVGLVGSERHCVVSMSRGIVVAGQNRSNWVRAVDRDAILLAWVYICVCAHAYVCACVFVFGQQAGGGVRV